MGCVSVFDMTDEELSDYVENVMQKSSEISYVSLNDDDTFEIGYINDKPVSVVVRDIRGDGEIEMDYDAWVYYKDLLGVDESTEDIYARISDYVGASLTAAFITPSDEDLSRKRY